MKRQAVIAALQVEKHSMLDLQRIQVGASVQSRVAAGEAG